MPHVLLLRAPTAGSDGQSGAQPSEERDPYEAALEPFGASSVPVYDTVLAIHELRWILETGPSFHGYKGVVLTSKRAVDAWASASEGVHPPTDDRGESSRSGSFHTLMYANA